MSLDGLERLLVGSLPTACKNLTNYLEQCFDSDVHAKGFYEFLPKFCQILFGSKESRGWLHLPLSKAEEDPLHEMLVPGGIFMRFLLSRFMDTGFIYEMVPDSLPRRTQLKLDPTQYLGLPPIYLSRVNLVKTTATIGTQKTITQVTKVNLNFNMLEYFLFYFAYALTLDDDDVNCRGIRRTDPKMAFRVNGPPTNSQASTSSRQSNWTATPTLKPPASRVLVEGSFFDMYRKYLHYFVPIPDPIQGGSSPAPKADAKIQPFNIFKDTSIENSTDQQQTKLSISEFFIGTLVELWLGQNDRSVDNRTIRYIQPGADIAECVHYLISHLAKDDLSQYILGGDLVRSHGEVGQGKNATNVVGMARRSAYQYIHPQLYTFLQLGLKFWTLDDTFRSLVGAWVAWITPWRYGLNDPPLTGEIVTEKWQVPFLLSLLLQPFVFDNLLFYTALLELYMPRMSNAPQSSRSLTIPAPFTLSKELRSIQKVMTVFKAQNLKEILKVAEQAIVWPENFSDTSFAAFEAFSDGALGGAGSGRPDVTSAFLASMVNALQRQVQQLEGSHYKYEALFLVEGPGRSKIRMLLTKLGNAVDLRQERLIALEAKNAATEQLSGWGLVSSKLNTLWTEPAPKTVSQDTAVYKRELKALRDTMKMVGEVFDLYPNVVASFEKQQHGAQERSGTLSAEQLAALIPPLEEDEATGLLGTGRQRRYVPRGLVRASVDDIKGAGPRAQQVVLSYENEFLVKHTRRLENHFTPKLFSTYLTSSSSLSAQQQRQHGLHVSRTAPENDHIPLGRYDAHVKHVPVYRWEKPGERSSSPTTGEQQQRRQTLRRTAAEPVYTIELPAI
ncbi:sphingomyelin phosphodiesterase 4, neutral membrane (neutral sphingomyelinase-3) [Mortierella polycephala]|uniref:Sphingomyelin phosphodiesterase 4, neutral membrane (Neutral sphingomyelinase-3) n=1 Tax=Mortierella polycephala TaxID=41804 RepID=A0A9P6QCK6_9FUNG|nr:sphingomyelin phosphodiesterase 4, neutral membrane (neutral sphingomyelinase-3) [Mortierella polycephala]